MNRLLPGACAIGCLLALSACDGGARKDYDSAARCQSLGQQPGTAEYDQCVDDEKLSRMLQQQRQDYERMKQQEMDQRLRRY